jgi:hypothetical protein
MQLRTVGLVYLHVCSYVNFPELRKTEFKLGKSLNVTSRAGPVFDWVYYTKS